MEIDVRESHTGVADTCRYQIAVRKDDGKTAIYHLDFKKIGQNMHHWFAPVYVDTTLLNNAFSLEFYDVKALSDADRHRRSAFDTYTAMHYTLFQRERLFVVGIGETLLKFAYQYHARIILSAPLRPALAKIYDFLLKKYAHKGHYLYKIEFIKDGLYVIEIPRSPHSIPHLPAAR
ncbi:hypothetical protein [Serratia marcescens]|uniref:hypothetical protein n=1 Tax=Serratia marcescens TaxID=615 RepID=UPI0023618488|nr:hypothetical protein [Serratia marcescens]